MQTMSCIEQGASKATSGNLRTTASLVEITDRFFHV